MGKKPKAEKKAHGRPRVITPTVVEQVAETMSMGVPEEFACLLHGVNPSTFGPALSRSPELQAIKKKWDAKFMERACKAIAAGGEIETINGADGPRDVRKPWQGFAWLLERRFRQHFCRLELHAPADDRGEPSLSPDQMAWLQKKVHEKYVAGQSGKDSK